MNQGRISFEADIAIAPNGKNSRNVTLQHRKLLFRAVPRNNLVLKLRYYKITNYVMLSLFLSCYFCLCLTLIRLVPIILKLTFEAILLKFIATLLLSIRQCLSVLWTSRSTQCSKTLDRSLQN